MSSCFNKSVYIVVTPFFPSPTNWRGAYCYDFVKALQADGTYEVRVFVPGSGLDYEFEGIKVRRFRTWQLPSNILPFLFRWRNEQSFLAAVKRAGIDLNDVAICHGHTANFAIYPLSVKHENAKCLTLLHHHDPQSFGLGLGLLRHFWPYKMIQFPILRALHEKIDRHVFVSEFVKKSFESAPATSYTSYADYKRQMRWLPYRPARIKDAIVLHNGVDEKIFKPKVSGCSNKIFTIGCVGNFIDFKGQMTLLRAARTLKDVKLIFVGSGPLLETCRVYAAQNAINAEFRSEVLHEDLVAFYHSLDLFCLPSFFEGFGCVFTEAYACGVPFITCEGQGMDDMIVKNERKYWLAKPNDYKDLRNKIVYFREHCPHQSLADAIYFSEIIPPFLRRIRA